MRSANDVMASEPTILYEDDFCLVLDKPAGLLVHADGRASEPTLVDWLASRYPVLRGVGETQRLIDGTVVERPGIVHRLDRETSGAILVAKTQDSFEHFKTQFQDRKVQKLYRAICHGIFKDDKGAIERPIGRSRKDFRLWSAQRLARGKLREALTLYQVLGRRPEASYLSVEPKTGRTHQIRVHLKAIHHPVVGDTLYAPKLPLLFGFTRLALHACSLSFITPDGTLHTVSAPLPKDFESALATHPFEPVAPRSRA